MKKILLGSIMFLAGTISVALLLAGSMAQEWNTNSQFVSGSSWDLANEQFSAFWNLSQYGLMSILYIFIGIAIVGMAVAIIGLFENKD